MGRRFDQSMAPPTQGKTLTGLRLRGERSHGITRLGFHRRPRSSFQNNEPARRILQIQAGLNEVR